MKGLLVFAVTALALLPTLLDAQWGPGQSGINFRSYRRGNYSGLQKPVLDVLNTQGDLQKIWPRLSGEDSSMAPTDVKWGEERLILVSLGERPTSGYTVFVKAIERNAGNLVVTYIERKPPAGQALLTVITSPWELVRAPRVAGNISFEKVVDRGLGSIKIIDLGGGACGSSCGCKCTDGCCQ